MNNLQRILIFIFLQVTLLVNGDFFYLNNRFPQLMTAISPISSVAGLYNRLEMLSSDYHISSVPIVKGNKAGNETLIIQRTPADLEGFIYSHFYNFRDENFFLNIYGNKRAITAYLQWICNTSTSARGIDSLSFEYLQYQILDPAQAISSGFALNPLPNKKVLEIPCLR